MPRLEGRNAHILISPVKAAAKPDRARSRQLRRRRLRRPSGGTAPRPGATGTRKR